MAYAFSLISEFQEQNSINYREISKAQYDNEELCLIRDYREELKMVVFDFSPSKLELVAYQLNYDSEKLTTYQKTFVHPFFIGGNISHSSVKGSVDLVKKTLTCEIGDRKLFTP